MKPCVLQTKKADQHLLSSCWSQKQRFYEDFIYRELGHAKHGIIENNSDPVIEQGLPEHGEIQGGVHPNLFKDC